MTKTYIGTKIIQAWPESRPQGEGYAVKYPDGYMSWSPKITFEDSYRAIEGDEQSLTFGDAVVMLKQGKRIARNGWNGKGQFVYLVPGAAYPVQTGAAKAHFGEGSMVPYNAYLAIKTVAETVSTWAPSVNDVLAEDWYALD